MNKVRKLVFVALVIAEIVVQYWKLPALKSLLGPIALACWALALMPADRTSRRISLVLVAAGILLFLRNHASLYAVVESFSENTNVLMVMTLIPLIGVAVDLGGYADALAVASRTVQNPRSLYVLSVLLAFAIGSVLLNAAIALLWVVLFPVAERARKDPQWFLVKSLPRGYDASLLWTPASPSTAVALSVSGAAWTAIAAPGFAVSLIILLLAIAVEWKDLADRDMGLVAVATKSETAATAPVDRPTKLKLAALATGLLSFIAGIVVMESLGVTIYQAVLPCVLGTLLIWTGLIRKVPQASKAFVNRLDDYMSRMSTQFLLMTTAGFIGTAVKMATAKGLPGLLSNIGGNTLVFTFLVSILVVLLSIVGIHPQIGMVITYSLFATVAQTYSAGYVCLALLLGAALGFNVSPVSATMLVTSACAGTNSIEVGLKRHWKYALLVLPVAVLLIRALGRP